MTENKLICPFCGEPLYQTYSFNPTQFWCSNYHDPKHPINVQGTKELWQELITTRKALDVAVDALKDIRCIYTGDQTTKPSTMFGRAAGALNKIQDLEQKDVK